MQKLIFVYNGDSGLLNGVVHFLHKRISPDTYPCKLCGIIYDGTALNKDWLAFVKDLGLPAEFLHRDEFKEKYGEHAFTFPIVLAADSAQNFKVLLKAEDFENIGGMDGLKKRLRDLVSVPSAERFS
jgi:hypothetical protein